MKVRSLSEVPPPDLARALSEFEAPFIYPLGPGRFFRISHGADYSLFFRAQGIGSCFIAETQRGILGVLGTAIRKLWMPDGTGRSAAYFGDLKIASHARGGRVLLKLARAADDWLRPRVQVAFGIAMDGTSLTPEVYTGRAGIPEFKKVGKVVLLRVAGGSQGAEVNSGWLETTAEKGQASYLRLSSGRYAVPVGEPSMRSQITPVWITNSDESACGLLEDTRKAKRLIADDGSEMISAHLSCFAWQSVFAGAELLRAALRHARGLGFPALFVSVDEKDFAKFRELLRDLKIETAPATIYGTGLAEGSWNINSSEI